MMRLRSISGRLIIGSLFLLILQQSCSVGPNLTEHPVPVPEQYLNDTLVPDSTELMSWWTMFNDPVLDSLVKLSLDTNRNLLVAIQRVEQTRLQSRIAKGDFGPKISATGTMSSGNYLNVPTGDQLDVYLGGATLSWEIDFWGKYRRLSQNAKATYLSTVAAQRAVQISLISEVTNQYFDLLEYQAALTISEETVELRLATLEIIKARFEEGISAEIDLNQSEIQYAIAKQAVPIYRELYYNSMLALRLLTGQNPGPVVAGLKLQDIELKDSLPPGLPAQIIERRPDIQQAWFDAIAQNALVGVAQANRFPSITLTGLLGVAGSDFSNFGATTMAWNAGAGLIAPLFYWNQNLRRVQFEKAGTQAALFNYENQVLIALSEVESALIGIQANEDRIDANQDRTVAALNALNLSDQRYIRGVTSYLEYLESQRQAFEAQLALASSRGDLLRSYMALYRATGGGWISEEEKQAFEDEQAAEEANSQ